MLRPAPPRRGRTWTDGEIAALLAPVFGVAPDGLGFVVLIQTPDGRSDATSNLENPEGFLREAIEAMDA